MGQSKYIPGGSGANVARRIYANAGQIAQIAAMHAKWLAEQFPSRVTKQEPTRGSISQIKLEFRCHRAIARMIAQKMNANEAVV